MKDLQVVDESEGGGVKLLMEYGKVEVAVEEARE